MSALKLNTGENPLQMVIFDGNGTNRFCIVLKSEKPVDDLVWAVILSRLNMEGQLVAHGIEAHLEQPKKVSR